jgi:hypothetical protein
LYDLPLSIGQNMDNNNKILQELQQVAPALAPLPKINPYRISPNYFSSLPDEIIKRTKSDEDLNLDLPKQNPYNVSSDYFKNLPVLILKRIEKEEAQISVFEEMEQISPLLNTIPKAPVYTVPGEYFNEIELKKQIIKGRKAKVVSFATKRNVIWSVVAAIFVGVLCLGVVMFKGNQRPDTVAIEPSKPVFGVQKLTEQEIITFLKTTSPADAVVSNANTTKPADTDITISVSKIPDTEIQEFLKENGEM